MRPSVQSDGVATKDIRPSTAYTICDVCGRTLLRGERSEVYIAGGARREVCELCKPRALHEGWVREGTLPTYDAGQDTSNRRGSFLSRLRRRRERDATPGEAPLPDDEFEALPEPEPPPEPRAPRGGRARAGGCVRSHSGGGRIVSGGVVRAVAARAVPGVLDA
jgi:hypothetical protein